MSEVPSEHAVDIKEEKQLLINANPSILLEVDDNNLLIRCNIPPTIDINKFIFFLYRLNKGEFVDVILQAINERCKSEGKVQLSSEIIDEFSRLWKNNKPAIRPTQVFRDKQ